MSTLRIEVEDTQPAAVACDDAHLHVTLVDGRTLSAPLWWYPRLAAADHASRNEAELMPLGIHWPALDEDISIASIVRGERAPGAKEPA